MSERLENPRFSVSVGENEYEARPDNATLYTFMGKTAINGIAFDNDNVNHIFMSTGEHDETGELRYRYIFLGKEAVENVLGYMVINGYTCHLNLTEVAECDMDAYQNFSSKLADAEAEQIPDTFPEDWS